MMEVSMNTSGYPVCDCYGNVLAYRTVHGRMTLNPRFGALHVGNVIVGHPAWHNWDNIIYGDWYGSL